MNLEKLIEAFTIRDQWQKDKSISREQRRALLDQWSEIFEEADKELKRARISTSIGDLFPCFLLRQDEKMEGDFTYSTGKAICLYGQFDCKWINDDVWVSADLTNFLKQEANA